jgi:short-subunit dehydrogenase
MPPRQTAVLITGASSGIGAALATEYARQGARLLLLARRRERLQALCDSLRSTGAAISIHTADVTRDGDVASTVAELRAAGGELDIVIANAGFGVAGMVRSLSLDDYRRQFETNVFGVLRTIRESVGALRAGGRVVIIGSVAGHIAAPGMSAYAMSKFSVRALSESLRGELRRDGIGVTLVSPGYVDSDIRRTDNRGELHDEVPDPIPAWQRMRANRAARQIVRGIARGRAELVITAHGKALVFVSRHFPWLVRWIAGRRTTWRREPGKR